MHYAQSFDPQTREIMNANYLELKYLIYSNT